MYVYRNTAVHSRNQCCHLKRSIIYYKCLYSCHSYHVCKLHLVCAVLYCELSGSTTFSTLSSWTVWFFGKGINEHKICFDFLCNFCPKHFSFQEEFSKVSQMYVFLYVKTRFSYQISMKLEFSPKVFEKNLSIKFHENRSSGNRVVPWGRRAASDVKVFRRFRNSVPIFRALLVVWKHQNWRPDAQLYFKTYINMRKPVVAFPNFAEVLKNQVSANVYKTTWLTGNRIWTAGAETNGNLKINFWKIRIT